MTAPFQLFSPLDAATEAALTESIRRFGVLVPVVRDQHGNVLDGHHRARIADTLGVKYRIDVVNVADEDEGREIARTLNADRRQLDAEQRRQVAQHLREQGHSLRAIGKAVGTSQTQVQRDLAGVTDVTPAPTSVRGQDGKTYPAKPKRPTIVPAKDSREALRAQDALAILGDDAPERVVDVKRAERMGREKQAEERRLEPVPTLPAGGDIDLRHGDFQTVLADLEPASVDAIICDPPYTREMFEYGKGLSALGAMAAELLKPTGVLAVMFGTGTIPEATRVLGEHMTFKWCMAWMMVGARARMHHVKVGTGWKPVYLYVPPKHTDPARWLLDDVVISTGDDKRHHYWGQNEVGFGELVERLTAPGDLVVDPFLGGGTTAVVCRDLGRRFIGCDIDAGAVHTSRERVA